MLSIDSIQRSFGTLRVLRGISLNITEGEIICLLGPSGCGKTTLLRIVAGLETADSGDVLINGQSILNTPVHARDFGLMFQDFALFPHMNVAQNVLFGLRMHHVPKEQSRQRLSEVLALVGLEDYEKRSVTELSGGERQRVALARSLAPNPRLLMLDEPLGSLDAALRERLVVELHTIIKQLGLTAIYVTHDQHEAFAIADRIAVMNAGQIEQVDTPPTLYRKPQTTFVARFLGFSNVVPITVKSGSQFQTPLGSFPAHNGADALLLHPDGLQVTSGTSPLTLDAAISEIVFSGDSYRVEAQHSSGMMLTFRISSREIGSLKIGDAIQISVDEECVIPLKGEA